MHLPYFEHFIPIGHILDREKPSERRGMSIMTQMEVLRRRSRLQMEEKRKTPLLTCSYADIGDRSGSVLCICIQDAPLILDIATNESESYTRIINNAVMQTLREEDIGYGDMVYFEKDYEGKITALCTNTSLLNMLSSRITETVLEKLDQVDTNQRQDTAVDSKRPSLLAGSGPVIKLKIVPLTVCARNSVRVLPKRG